jgi:hypothetical protein
MIAAIALGEGVLPPPATYGATAVIVAMVIHFVLSDRPHAPVRALPPVIEAPIG